MARVLKGSHSFTCTPSVYPLKYVLCMLTDRNISNVKCVPGGKYVTVFQATSDKAAQAERRSKAENRHETE